MSQPAAEMTPEQRAAKASLNRGYREHRTPEQAQAIVDRARVQRQAREAAMTPEQREHRRAMARAGAARFREAHGGKGRARTEEQRNRRRRQPQTVAPVTARQKQQITTGAENKVAWEMAIRRVVAKAADHVRFDRPPLDSSSEWAGMTPDEILAAPLPPIRGATGWFMPEAEVAAIRDALAKAEGDPQPPTRSLSLVR